MFDKKVYAIVTKGFTTYAAHIEEWRLGFGFSSKKIVTKAEYKEARKNGMPSWGEWETKMKMEDSIYKRKSKCRKDARPA